MGEHPGPVGDRANLVSLQLQGTGERLARGTVILGQQDTLLHGSNTSGRGTVRSHQELSESREDVSR
jgi:hypothetical protein